MKNIIFEILNQCGVLLADTGNLIFFTIKDIRLFRHLRKFELSISLGIRQRHSLEFSNDDGIFILQPHMTQTLISSVSWASPLKIVYTANSLTCLWQALGVLIRRTYHYAYRELLGLFLPLERSNGINDRQLSYKKQIGRLPLLGGEGNRLVFSLASKISFPLTGLLNLK